MFGKVREKVQVVQERMGGVVETHDKVGVRDGCWFQQTNKSMKDLTG